jgi:hypothetical protein
MKIYVVAIETLMLKGRHDEIQFTTKIKGFFNFTPP